MGEATLHGIRAGNAVRAFGGMTDFLLSCWRFVARLNSVLMTSDHDTFHNRIQGTLR